ncbi:sensor histidine kinase [Cellulomonas xiejunii]|uniref:histidine kinase n=1 Tax=Cellulomonas xiejunii TaxID=2968083 RepID=A0ABY5KNY9_9CELL|nr:histidine kinase [Cellulomonas xiejunii]MCC2322151.1 histidine kinase [Cellulomonas xiejunii]MCC2323206.1 histidine kinase [Cellulomonas xiejunii]UUI72207.1 histidine kinase [Cellulomonas xiejunii]
MIEDPAAHRRRPTDVVPVVCWVLSLALLSASVVIIQADPQTSHGVPGFGDAAWWWAVAVLSLQAVALAGLGRHPRAALLAVAAGVPAMFVVGGDAIGVGLVTVMVATYRAVLARPARRLLATLLGAAALVAAGVAAATVRSGGEGWVVVVAGLLQGVAAVGLPFVLGSVVAARHDALTALAATADAQDRERDALVQVAVERERTAMARELHDIAAHHLSGIAVMTGAIGRQIDVDPEGAKVAVAQVREQSTAMLRDLRNLVVLLRDVDAPVEPGGPVRMETLAGIDDLVAGAQAAGLPVSLTTAGPVGELAASGAVGPLAQLAAYRVVQEALANAARHAPGARCEVRLDASDEGRVDVVVRNGRPAAGQGPAHHDPGYGLVGMQERAELTGATLRFGATLEGGWQVTLSVPTAVATAVPDEPTTSEEEGR